MSSSPDPTLPLRQALEHSPDNVPLRVHLAETLLSLGRAGEAQEEYQLALQQQPDNDNLKVGLAKAFSQQGKDSHALVIIESLVKQDRTPAAAYLLHCRLLLRQGDVEFAISQYRAAVEEDESLRDEELEARLGIDADPDESDVIEGRIRLGGEGEEEGTSLEIDRPKIGFDDVGGMEKVKDEIRMKIIHPLENAELFAQYGKKIGGGILMYGPPGCGKTHLARATAGQIHSSFLSVGISDVLDMWMGNSEKNLRGIFQYARANKPCVLFFDEVDALGASRTDMRSASARHHINQFLAELDGIDSSNDGLLVLAATNAPWHLDPAFRRPGRFDRILFVPPPDQPARASILRLLCQGKPSRDIDFDHVAKKTADFSGADLTAVVDVAVEAKLTEAMKTGVPTPITTKDLTSAAKTIRPSTKQWFATAKNYAVYSNEGGVYDDILTYLGLKK